NYAFIVSEASGHGMQVFDLTRLRNVPNPPVTFTEDAHYAGWSNAHNVVINEDTGFAYGVGSSACSGGLAMVNIQNPLNPTNAGCFSSDGYTHDAQCVIYQGPDAAYVGKEICFNSNEDTLTIVDVTNKAAPVQLSRNPYSGSRYTHQGWITDDHHYFLIDDELDEQTFGHNTRTRVFDISSLTAPTLVGYHDGVTPAIDHNMYVVGDYVFQANYRSGLRILDITDVGNANMTEEAFFDIYPSSDSPSFNGAWSVYPYFESGVVVVSGIEQGLFILAPTLAPDFNMSLTSSQLTICNNGNRSTTVNLTPKAGYTGNVTLSTVGLPNGASSNFSVNPVAVPGSSNMTVGANGVPAGSYPFMVHGTDGTLSHDEAANLTVVSGAPNAPTLIAPLGVDQPPLPTFQWTPANQGMSYLLVVKNLTNGNLMYAVTPDTSYTFATPLDPLTIYAWSVRAYNPCGTGNFAQFGFFRTQDIPPILVVDDDDNAPNVQSTYTGALDALGLTYDLWDTGNSDNEPDAGYLQQYDVVIWFTGDEFGGAAGPGAAGEAALATYLNAGGCLLISSQDYVWDRGVTGFMQSYLGIASATSDVSQSTVTGAAIYAGLGPYTLAYPFTNYSDLLNPAGGAATGFSGNQGSAAVVSGTHKAVFMGFPYEAIPAAGRGPVLSTTLNWCSQ
ncbi:MAG: choice-of-anchor B family protein, partial [Anaerolineales bacterium]|nr:choice-of-anchor B family protein [Anaerolineales bacterium]